eukprot:s1002_g13.t1
MQSSLFRTRFESALDYVAARADHMCVAMMPDRVMQNKARNRLKLQLCSAPMTEEEQDFILSMMNEDWDLDIESSGQIVHYCEPGCCHSDESFHARMRKALEIAFGSFFEPPLMYRWKGWEPASHYLTRGLAIHKLLVFFWLRCMSSDDRQAAADGMEDLQEDSPDASPAAMFVKSIIVTKPLSDLMDQISLVESIRHRLRMRRCGLGLADSQVQHTEEDLAELNLRLISGEEGCKTVANFCSILLSPNMGSQLGVWGIPVLECVDSILLGMADTWRRTVLPFQCQPWQCLRIARMDAENGLCFLRQEQAKVLIRNIFKPGATAQQKRLAYESMKLLIVDLLCDLPASSVEVEKAHANVQIDVKGRAHSCKRPHTIQQDSFITSVCLEHARLKSAVEEEVLGSAKRTVFRVLRSRLVDSTAPGSTLAYKKKRQCSSVRKRQTGILKGLD